MSRKCYYCEEIGHTGTDIYLCLKCEHRLLSRQWSGNSYKEENDNFAVRTKLRQIFQGFKTKEDAQTWGDKELSERDFEIIESGYFIETNGLLYDHIMKKQR